MDFSIQFFSVDDVLGQDKNAPKGEDEVTTLMVGTDTTDTLVQTNSKNEASTEQSTKEDLIHGV